MRSRITALGAGAGRALARDRRLVWLADIAAIVISGVGAFLLRFDFALPPLQAGHLWWGLGIWIPVKALIFRLMGLDRVRLEFVSVPEMVALGLGNLSAALVSTGLILGCGPSSFPRSVYLLDLVLCLLATGGVRVGGRLLLARMQPQAAARDVSRVVIYGAGEAGVALLRQIRSSRRLPYHVVGFVDDNRLKSGGQIHGTMILGTGEELARLAARHQVDEVLIAVPAATGRQMAAILERCHEAGLRCKTVPSLAEMLEGKGAAAPIREVAVEDLLGRSPVVLDEHQIREKLKGRRVLVTGAAGSIGSELCRQLARFSPSRIVGFDTSENGLFLLNQEMRERWPQLAFEPEVGSIRSRSRLDEVMQAHAPTIVYHAAAYKHVPMMESNPFEAMENNILGTREVALAALRHGVTDMVMISSDKAVRPTSVMGVSKRVAELVVNSMNGGETNFVSVRFGNVLGSNGSVVPIFRKQIAAGGPVKVTHPEMRRYFMTIPEAAQLVLQASSMGKGGEIFVLEMGEPVKIVDLARNMILLSGLRPNRDVRIEFTGIRPGEKLYEELSSLDESTAATRHEKIRVYHGVEWSRSEMNQRLEGLETICRMKDTAGLVLWLKSLEPEYNPSALILERMLKQARSFSGSLDTLAEVLEAKEAKPQRGLNPLCEASGFSAA